MNNFKSIHSYRKFSDSVINSNRYVWDSDVDEFLAILLEKGRNKIKTISADHTLWRAQLGHDWVSMEVTNNLNQQLPCPFSKQRMKPQKDRAKEGRANPKGIPYLYTAEEKDTAMAEVRPSLGSLISLAELKTVQILKIVDFTGDHSLRMISYLLEDDQNKIDNYVWSEIGESFSRPINPSDDWAGYVPTQIIAEFFKNNGFSGIAYNSAFGKGHNILLFDVNCAKVNDCRLYEVENMSFKFNLYPDIKNYSKPLS